MIEAIREFMNFAQIELWPCKVCDNRWWFDKPDRLQCTKCANYELKEYEIEEHD